MWVLLYGTNVSEWTDDLNYIKYWQNVHKRLHVKPNWPVPTRYSLHYCDVIMGAVASQITSLTIVYSTVYSDADQRKHQSSVSLAFVRGIRQGPVNSPHKWPVTWKMFAFDDVIMNPHLDGIYCISLHPIWMGFCKTPFVILYRLFIQVNVKRVWIELLWQLKSRMHIDIQKFTIELHIQTIRLEVLIWLNMNFICMFCYFQHMI